MNSFPDPESLEVEISEALVNLNSPKKLSESNLLSLALVAIYKQKDPAALPYQTLKAVLTEILNLLEIENADYADILRGRFWEGLSPASMISNGRPKQWSEKTFYNHQKRARQEFAALLWQKEQESVLGPAGDFDAGDAVAPAAPAVVQPPARGVDGPKAPAFVRKPAAAIALVLGVLVLIAIIAAIQSAGGLRAQAAVTPAIANTQVSVANTATSPAASPTATTAATAAAAAPQETAPPVVRICGEGQADPIPVDGSVDRFIRSEGISSFTVENAPGMLNNKVRTVHIDRSGLWIGYFATSVNLASGLGHYDRASKNLSNCGHVPSLAGQNINAVLTDKNGTLWVATEKNGLSSFDGKEWEHYSTATGLPSNEIYGLTVDEENVLWISTWEGVVKFDGKAWAVPYTVQNGSLFNNHVHDTLFDSQGNIWVGHIERGISKYSQEDGTWVHFTAAPDGLGGNFVRGLALQKASDSAPEAVWVATQDGGVSRYQNDAWTTFRVKDGLPSDRVRAVEVDRYNRVWAATAKGVVYWDNDQWVRYNSLDTFSIAFGIACPEKDCSIDDDHVWTGTAEHGLTQSRIPLPKSETPLDVNSVCFELSEDERVCPDLVEDPATGDLTAAYPGAIAPDQQFQVYITVTPRADYALEETRGDMLVNTDADKANLFGRWERIKVLGTVDQGEPFEFADYDNLFTAPRLPENVQEQTYTSTWRVWRHNRFVGPAIRITFTVKQP